MAAISWIKDFIDMYKSAHPSYETKVVPGAGRTPKEAAQAEGEGFKPSYFSDYDPVEYGDQGYVRIHRRKR